MHVVESPFATVSAWRGMSPSKHNNHDAQSMMTSDTSLSGLPSLLPHPPCSQQQLVCQLPVHPISQPQNRLLASSLRPCPGTPQLQLPRISSQCSTPSSPGNATTRGCWGALTDHHCSTTHPCEPISLDSSHTQHSSHANPPRQHWHWGGSGTTTRKALKNHEHWTINSKYWTMHIGPWPFASSLLLHYVTLLCQSLLPFFN